MHSYVTLCDVSFEFSNGSLLFSNLYFSIETGCTALVGPNGVGKSTLAKLLTGELEPSHGTIFRQTSLSYFSQFEDPPEISVDEFLANNYEWSLYAENLLSEINRQINCKDLSGGEWMRVRLTRVLSEKFIIFDEPTNNLDNEARNILFQFINQFTGALLLISHDRELLRLCDAILELSNQGLIKFNCRWTEYEDLKNNEKILKLSKLEQAKIERNLLAIKRQKEIDRQEKRNQQGAKEAARGGQPKILIGARKRAAQKTTGKIDAKTYEKSNQAVNEAFSQYKRLKTEPVMYAVFAGQSLPAQKLVFESINFNIKYKDWLFKNDLSINWRGNIRIAVTGKNGAGKSTLIKYILGVAIKNYTDTRGVFRQGNLNSLYLDQQCSLLEPALSVFENIRNTSSMSESEIRNSLAKFLFEQDKVFQKVNTLSGGEKLRAALAKGLLQAQKPELLILDEPTNNLDLGNIKFLEKIVSEFRGAVIIVSHDQIFLEKCNLDTILEL